MSYFSVIRNSKLNKTEIETPQLEVREEIKEFVNRWNSFVDKRYRIPMYGCVDPEEVELYDKRMGEFSPHNITKDEELYLKLNLAKSKVRKAVVNHVRAYNEYVLINGCAPRITGQTIDRDNVFDKLPYLNKPINLNEYEQKYIDENTIKVVVRIDLRKFITQFNDFVQKNGRYPKRSKTDKMEDALYKAWWRYSKTEVLTDKEKDYYKENIINLSAENTTKDKNDEKKVKKTIIRFVNNYKLFIQIYGSEPKRCGTRPNEVELYKQKWRFTQKKYLSSDDAKYLMENGFNIIESVENVRNTIIKFVNNYTEFVQTYGSEPKYSGTMPGERDLYRRKRRLTQIENIRPEEIEYLRANGFTMETCDTENSLIK